MKRLGFLLTIAGLFGLCGAYLPLPQSVERSPALLAAKDKKEKKGDKKDKKDERRGKKGEESEEECFPGSFDPLA